MPLLVLWTNYAATPTGDEVAVSPTFQNNPSPRPYNSARVFIDYESFTPDGDQPTNPDCDAVQAVLEYQVGSAWIPVAVQRQAVPGKSSIGRQVIVLSPAASAKVDEVLADGAGNQIHAIAHYYGGLPDGLLRVRILKTSRTTTITSVTLSGHVVLYDTP